MDPTIVQEVAVRHQFIILADGPDALNELCGISLLERLLRTLQRLGLTKAIVLSATPDLVASHLEEPSPHRARIALDLRHRAPGSLSVPQIAKAWPNDSDRVIVIRGDGVFDPRLIELLDDQDTTAALVDSAPPPGLQSLVARATTTSRGRLCGAVLISRDWAKSRDGLFAQALSEEIATGAIQALDIAGRVWHHPSMRRQSHPTWFPVPAPEEEPSARRFLIQAAQKGSLDFPAMVHGPIENFLISHLCRKPITPNQLTAMTNIAAWGATFLFATGRLGWGAILALAVGILDGLDGKQARVKIETTKAGQLEHWFDAFFEHSWWIAIAYGLESSGRLPGAFLYLILLMGAEALAGLAKFSVIRSCGRTLDELGDFNRIVRLVGGRRNIYVWVFALGALLGVPADAFKIMSIWAAITAAVQVPRAAIAIRAHRERRVPPEFPAEA
ncbi:MAG: CDP-alcohol phosphatidyltransferase family protein [Blastocatellia bacterium]|nr:CDP-alcohol phosphatidyltransferase family protein [Blastocatellia bacterium]